MPEIGNVYITGHSGPEGHPAPSRSDHIAIRVDPKGDDAVCLCLERSWIPDLVTK